MKLLIFLGTSVLFFFSQLSYSGKINQDKRNEVVMKYSNYWKSFLGDIDLSDEYFFQRIIFLKPQPKEKFKKFEGVKLSRGIKELNEIWFRVILKKEIVEKINIDAPDGYYLREKSKDESLLIYSMKDNRYNINILINFTVFLINLKPYSNESSPTFTKHEIIELLKEYTNIKKLSNIENLLKKENYSKGIVFSYSESGLGYIKNWDDDIVCFITENGIYIILFKLFKDRSLKGIPRDNKWLDKGRGLIELTETGH